MKGWKSVGQAKQPSLSPARNKMRYGQSWDGRKKSVDKADKKVPSQPLKRMENNQER